VVEGRLLFGVGARGARHGTEGFGGRIMGVMVTLGVGMERRADEGVEVFEGGGGGSACCQSRVVQEMKRETFHARHVRCVILILVLYQVPRRTCVRRRSGPALSLAVMQWMQAIKRRLRCVLPCISVIWALSLSLP
jgi:hypothetical protein